MQNILQLFYEPRFSGISKHLIYLLRAMDREKHDIWVLCSTADGKILRAFLEVMPENRLKIVPPGRLFSFRGTLEAVRLIRSRKIDTVHIHNLPSAGWGYTAALLGGCRRIVFTPHVGDIGIPPLEKVFRLCWKALRPFTHMYIAVSKSQRDRLLRWGVARPGQVTFIPNHIDAAELDCHSLPDREEIRRNLGLTPDAVVVCQIGRLDRQKNPEFLVKVAELTRERAPEMIFLLVGEGILRDEIERAIQARGLEGRVRLLGFRNDAIALLNASDILTLTSRWEGFPYVLVEATCMSMPMVTTITDGSSDIVEDGRTGYLVTSEEECADRLVRLARSSELRTTMGRAGYERNRALFDLRGMARDVEAVYA